jgi:hypothetical protein
VIKGKSVKSPAELPNVRLGLTVSTEGMADLESLVTEVDPRPWVASWAFRIGLERILQDGFGEAIEQYWRSKDPAVLARIESHFRTARAQAGRRALGRRPCALNFDDVAGLSALGIAGGK